jgi:hypothetical protein
VRWRPAHLQVHLGELRSQFREDAREFAAGLREGDIEALPGFQTEDHEVESRGQSPVDAGDPRLPHPFEHVFRRNKCEAEAADGRHQSRPGAGALPCRRPRQNRCQQGRGANPDALEKV